MVLSPWSREQSQLDVAQLCCLTHLYAFSISSARSHEQGFVMSPTNHVPLMTETREPVCSQKTGCSDRVGSETSNRESCRGVNTKHRHEGRPKYSPD